MRVFLRIIAVITTLCFAGSSTLSAMPLVWCIGNDGHRAVEAILHQHTSQSSSVAAQDEIPTSPQQEPCSDWQLLSAAGTPHAKAGGEAPKSFTVDIAYPPLKLVVAQKAPPGAVSEAVPRPPAPQAHLRALRSVVLLI
jgi:hypothetical protein